ncbi:MAG: pyridoxal-dependent decarboxylase [Acidimicrobiales bacterium]|jgi:glutamate/tyrosine decarboxylase-like PLP-dependent enzyme|nr:aspartate aminotransferase family protein [Acidimicrobiia bacterium]HIL48371.1 aspartate aminotransferase family protein [Acidimicrobiia bacterium]
MHDLDAENEDLVRKVIDYALERLGGDAPLHCPPSAEELHALVGDTITPGGLGGTEALRTFAEHLAPACMPTDHPRYLAFVASAPTMAASAFDLVVGSSSLCGSTWLDGAGMVFAENQALRWIADLAGMPDSAGGCFVTGGTMGNLSALVTARHDAVRRRTSAGSERPERWAVVAAESAHSSIDSAAGVMDVDVLLAAVDGGQRLRGDAVATAIAGRPAGTEVFAVVATAGTTNLGIVDDIDGVADACTSAGVWLHIDGAYGGAAMAAPSVRHRFAGIQRADSLVVDPHKWLFSPFDCAALVYANPALARAAHTQHAGYLEPIIDDTVWNPCDYANVLTRRARGVPFWFSLAVHGTDAYTDAIEHTLEVTRATRDLVEAAEHLELLVEPELSVVAFRRRGWGPTDYQAWCDRLLAAGTALLTPTTFDGGAAMRICIVNPRTSVSDLQEVLATLEPAGDPVT